MNIEKLEELSKMLKLHIRDKRKAEKLREKESEMYNARSTQAKQDKLRNNLNYLFMDICKQEHELHALSVECGFATKRKSYNAIEFNPDAWHCYPYQPRTPEQG